MFDTQHQIPRQSPIETLDYTQAALASLLHCKSNILCTLQKEVFRLFQGNKWICPGLDISVCTLAVGSHCMFLVLIIAKRDVAVVFEGFTTEDCLGGGVIEGVVSW